MTGSDYEAARYARMRWNTPLSPAHADLLLRHLEPVDSSASVHLLDLGCGWGELMLRAAAIRPALTASGVDIDGTALARGRAAAASRGLSGRVRFFESPSDAWPGRAERVACIGSSHAFGGTGAGLEALARHVEPGGRLLFGDGCWERSPAPAAIEMFGDEVLSLPALIETARHAGWRVLHLSTADQSEWDEFESSWRAGPEDWLLGHPDHPDTPTRRADLDRRLDEYLTVYRGVLGFAYLVLAR